MLNIAEGACANFGRRAFLRGGSAFLVAAGTGFKMFGAGKTLRLKFGVLSDIHITEKSNSCNVLETSLKRPFHGSRRAMSMQLSSPEILLTTVLCRNCCGLARPGARCSPTTAVKMAVLSKRCL